MLPADQLEIEVAEPYLVPCFLTEVHHPPIRELIAVYESCVGLSRRALKKRLVNRRDLPLSDASRARIIRELDALHGHETAAGVAPARIRASLFEAAARLPRKEALLHTARGLGVATADLERDLFRDLGDERLVRPSEQPIGPTALAALANASLAASLVARARNVRIEAWGNARDVVRYVRLRGLLCTVAELEPRGAFELQVSGPYALFRRTSVYGRALASMVPRLTWCDRFELQAELQLEGRVGVLRLATGDPIAPSKPPKRFDSRLEERFARDFARATSAYRLVREPAPIRSAGEGLFFPDFAVISTSEPDSITYIEIVGFWTEAYLERKLAQLASARVERLLVCIDEDRDCGQGELPAHARVIRFRRRIDVHAVLEAIARLDLELGLRPRAVAGRSCSSSASGATLSAWPTRRRSAPPTKTSSRRRSI